VIAPSGLIALALVLSEPGGSIVAKVPSRAGPQEAVNNAACVGVGSDYRALQVDRVGAGAYRARGIERGEATVGGPQEAMKNAACVLVGSGDRALRVDAVGAGVVY